MDVQSFSRQSFESQADLPTLSHHHSIHKDHPLMAPLLAETQHTGHFSGPQSLNRVPYFHHSDSPSPWANARELSPAYAGTQHPGTHVYQTHHPLCHVAPMSAWIAGTGHMHSPLHLFPSQHSSPHQFPNYSNPHAEPSVRDPWVSFQAPRVSSKAMSQEWVRPLPRAASVRQLARQAHRSPGRFHSEQQHDARRPLRQPRRTSLDVTPVQDSRLRISSLDSRMESYTGSEMLARAEGSGHGSSTMLENFTMVPASCDTEELSNPFSCKDLEYSCRRLDEASVRISQVDLSCVVNDGMGSPSFVMYNIHVEDCNVGTDCHVSSPVTGEATSEARSLGMSRQTKSLENLGHHSFGVTPLPLQRRQSSAANLGSSKRQVLSLMKNMKAKCESLFRKSLQGVSS